MKVVVVIDQTHGAATNSVMVFATKREATRFAEMAMPGGVFTLHEKHVIGARPRRVKFHVVIDLYPTVGPCMSNIGRIRLFRRRKDLEEWKRNNEPGGWVRCETEVVE